MLTWIDVVSDLIEASAVVFFQLYALLNRNELIRSTVIKQHWDISTLATQILLIDALTNRRHHQKLIQIFVANGVRAERFIHVVEQELKSTLVFIVSDGCFTVRTGKLIDWDIIRILLGKTNDPPKKEGCTCTAIQIISNHGEVSRSTT